MAGMLNEQSRRASLQVAPLIINKSVTATSRSGGKTGPPVSDPYRHPRDGHNGDRFAAAQACYSQAHMTPPMTPRTSQENVSAPDTYAAAAGMDDAGHRHSEASRVFHPFLRAFHPFNPPVTQMGGSVMMPLVSGDLVMIHSIHTNGWADGTLLVSGARGWLPTNYCEPYDPEPMRNLLHALLNFWDLLRSPSVNDRELFGNQEFMKGIIAGARHLLQRTNCLTREANAVQANETLKKGRKSLLSELSLLIKTAKRLQEMQATLGRVETGDVTLAVDALILGGFRLVFHAAKFLDTHDEERRSRAPPNVDIMATVLEESCSGPQPPLSSPSPSTSTSPSPVSPTSSSSSSSSPGLLPPSGRPSSSSRRSGAGSRSSHRASFAGPASVSQEQHLVSERLGRSHDAFLSQLSSFIGRLHLQSQSRPEVARAIRQAAASGAELLAVVDAVCAHSDSTADILGHNRAAVWEMIRDLAAAARSIFATRREADFTLPNDNIILRTAATGCVKAAGDCVAMTRWIMERIGDFEFEGEGRSEGLGIDLSLLDFGGDDDGATGDSPKEASLSSDHPASSTHAYINKPLPQVPQSDSSQSRGPTSPPRSQRSSTTTVSSSTSSSSLSSSAYSSTLPPLLETPASQRPEEANNVFPSADTRPDSSVGSMASTTAPQSRHSESSIISPSSTRATTPDLATQQKRQGSGSGSGSGSISGISTHSSITSADEVDDEVESQLQQKTFAHELMFNKEGMVTAGSLAALIERLTTHESTPDAMFVSTFQLTFRLFCTPEELAEALIDRFEYVAEAVKIAAPVRLRVYNVFKGWLESNWCDEKDREALPIIKLFAATKLTAALPSAGSHLNELADRVSASGSLVPRLVSSIARYNALASAVLTPTEVPVPAPSITKSQLNALAGWRQGTNTTLTVLDFDPLELARQLTLKQMGIFCSIVPEELLESQWTKNNGADAPNVKAMSSLSTDVSNLVSESILEHAEAKKRAAVIKQWIKVAQCCQQINNYDGITAIVCSLSNSVISRLRKTWDVVSPKRRGVLKELQEIMDPSQNHKSLRGRLHDLVPPCLPFLGMYLTDLTFLDLGNPATKQLQTTSSEPASCEASQSGGEPGSSGSNGCGLTVVNFDKHTRTAKSIGELQRFQIPYRFAEVSELQEWLSAQINRVRDNDHVSNAQMKYYRKSLFLEPREVSSGSSGGSAINGHGGLKTPTESGPMWGWIRDRSNTASQV